MKTIKVKSTSSNDKVTHSVIEKELDRLKSGWALRIFQKTLSKVIKALKVKEPAAKKKLSNREVMIETQEKDPYLWPKCQQEEMVVYAVIHGIRGSPMRYAYSLVPPAQAHAVHFVHVKG